MIRKLIIALVLIFNFYISFAQSIDFVNPFIGTGGHGHTYPGATAPFGTVQLSPDTRLTGWDGCSAYHYTDDVVYGFSHTHLSGTGISDYGDILVLPVQGRLKRYEKNKAGSKFFHSKEKASAGYYHTFLDDYGVNVDLTATPRCGFHKYVFSRTGEAKIFVDLKHRDHVNDSGMKVVNDYEIEGYRFSSAWTDNQKIFFVMRFSKKIKKIDIYKNGKPTGEKDINGADSIKAFFTFDLDDSKEILVKTGISFVDIEGARKNLDAEIPDWDFDKTLKQTQVAWQKQLGKIRVFSGEKDKKTIFYTALYHTMIVPNIFSDVDGRFRGMDDKIHDNPGYDTYTVFSLWDTYRATHPLYTLIEQKRTSDFINTFLAHQRYGGRLPIWELACNETYCMIGIHSISVIADAIMKGISGFDYNEAFEAMKSNMEQDKPELNYYRRYGFIPANRIRESVSKTLEYAFDDWSIARVADRFGNRADYRKYITRAQFYKNIFDPETHFMRARLNGGFRSPFDPREVDFNYTEANSWQYSFYVPQDIQGLIKLHGGKDNFTAKLDLMFNTVSETTGRHQADITGLIGQYAHGNEPSHHIAYLYNYAGQPWKTQRYVRKITDEMYHNAADGLVGNEDCGQMSAWYVFSALGFYSVAPGSNQYIIGSPLFEKVVVDLENGKSFNIITYNNSSKNIYIQSAKLNGKSYTKSYIRHEDIMQGGSLEFVMGDKPNKNWGTGTDDIPVSSIDDCLLLPAPYLDDNTSVFFDEKTLKLKHIYDDMKIYFKINSGVKTENKYKLYQKPIVIKDDTGIEFYADDKEGNKSYIVTANFKKIKKHRTVKIKNSYSSQYTGGGDNALIDMIRGGENFAGGSWQGYQGVDFEAVVEFGKIEEVHKVAAGFLQSAGAWIWMPEYVDFYYSLDGKTFHKIARIDNDVNPKEMQTVIKDFTAKTGGIKAHYIKVFAKNRGICPEWHPGAGGKAWIFVDEIEVK